MKFRVQGYEDANHFKFWLVEYKVLWWPWWSERSYERYSSREEAEGYLGFYKELYDRRAKANRIRKIND